MYKVLIFCLWLVLLAARAWSADHLLYLEGQEIFGYSSALEKTIAYSMAPNSEMQKPSLGFDYLGRLSSDSGDIASLAIQYRLAVTQIEQGIGYKADQSALEIKYDDYKTQSQFFNAFVKFKTPWSYVWVGHNRPAFGLSSYLDSHGLLLSTLGMRFGYDRDWGVGTYKDFSWGNISTSVTSGSGMGFYTDRSGIPLGSHYMVDARVGYGNLARDNFTAGLSASTGKTLSAVGYTLADLEVRPEHLLGTDLTFLTNNLEHRFDFYHGVWLGNDVNAFSYRLGLNLDEEGKYKIEAQPIYWHWGTERNYQDALCFSVRANSDLTVRTEYMYDHMLNDNRFLLQLYLYHLI